MAGAGPGARRPGRCATGNVIELRGDDFVMVTGLDQAGERFERTAAGWIPKEIVRADQGLPGRYLFAGDHLVSSSGSGGIQVHDTVDQTARIELTCPALASAEPISLYSQAPSTFDQRPVNLTLGVTDPGGAYFMIYGRGAQLRPLGPESQLCIGGALRIAPLTVTAPPRAIPSGGFTSTQWRWESLRAARCTFRVGNGSRGCPVDGRPTGSL